MIRRPPRSTRLTHSFPTRRSSDLERVHQVLFNLVDNAVRFTPAGEMSGHIFFADHYYGFDDALRSEEHTSELQSLMRISYAVFCLKKKKKTINYTTYIRNDLNRNIAMNTIKPDTLVYHKII